MPRKPRVTAPASFLHIMARGIEGRDIFSTNTERTRFLDLLSIGLRRTGYACFAWALMPNHYHLVVRSSERHPSELMRPLNAAYAQYFSKIHDRRGYLFQDRYKSRITQDQLYLEALIRYVHSNPLRAGICKTLTGLDKYPWTGHAVLMGNARADFQTTWPVLRRFGTTAASGRKGYRAFMAEAMGEFEDNTGFSFGVGRSGISAEKPGAYVIGDPDFVRSVLARDRERRLQLRRYRLEGLSVHDVATKLTAAAGIEMSELLRRGRSNRKSKLRKLFAWACHRLYGFSIVDVAKYLGCSHSPMSLAVKQGEKLAEDEEFANILIALRP